MPLASAKIVYCATSCPSMTATIGRAVFVTCHSDLCTIPNQRASGWVDIDSVRDRCAQPLTKPECARRKMGRDMAHLGIDIGTSAVKLCVTNASGAVVATADAALSSQHPFSGASEQDPSAWIEALQQACSALPAPVRAGVRAIGLSGQMHGAVMLDSARAPIRPAILWNDGRAAAQCEQMTQAAPDVGEITGVPVMPGFTAPKLLWLKEAEPEAHNRIAHVILPKDYLGLYLHGGLVTDPSDAAGTSWFDQAAGVWSEAVCAASATDVAWLPEVRNGSAVAGHVNAAAASALGLPEGIPVAAGAGDAAAGAVGIGAVAAGDGFISLGTSGQLFVTTDSYRPNPQARTHAYAHTLPGLWFQMAAMLNGARPMAWLAALLDRPIAELLVEAEAADDAPLFLPYLSGERTPHGDADIRGGFWGLSESTSHGSLMRAVVEAIAFSFTDARDAMGGPDAMPETLLAIGGGTRSDFVLQMIADATGTRIGRSDGADLGPALGAARLAQMALGASVAQAAPKPEVTRWFEPNADEGARLARRLVGYRALYPALKSVNAAMT